MTRCSPKPLGSRLVLGTHGRPLVLDIQLIAAGTLIAAAGRQGKPLDYQALERWTQVGYERGMRSRKGER